MVVKAAKSATITRKKSVEVEYLGRHFAYTYKEGSRSEYENGMTISKREGGRHNHQVRVEAGEGDPTEWVSNLIRELTLFQQGLIAMHSKEEK